MTIGNFLIDDLEFLNEDVSSSAMVTEPHITSPPPIVDFELEADATRLNSPDHDNAGEADATRLNSPDHDNAGEADATRLNSPVSITITTCIVDFSVQKKIPLLIIL